jgi:hypothetical protein
MTRPLSASSSQIEKYERTGMALDATMDFETFEAYDASLGEG